MCNTKIAGNQTKQQIERFPDAGSLCVSHTTMSDTLLTHILTGNEISLRASRVDTFWKPEERDPDDNHEFKGLVKLLGHLNIGDQKTDTKSSKEPIEHKADNVANHLAHKVLAESAENIICSTTTPYILCFSTALDGEDLPCRFCSHKSGFPVSLILDFDTLCDSANATPYFKNAKDEKPDIKYSELVQIYYADKDDEYIGSNAKCQHSHAINELHSIDASTNSDVRKKDGDYDVDACFYVKRGKYACEKEIRYVVRTNSPCAFCELHSGENGFAFATDSMLESKEQDDAKKYLYLRFNKYILKGIIFAPCVSKERAVKFASQLTVAHQEFSDLKFYLSDCTPIQPKSQNSTPEQHSTHDEKKKL